MGTGNAREALMLIATHSIAAARHGLLNLYTLKIHLISIAIYIIAMIMFVSTYNVKYYLYTK